jgi:hypothetical protein
LLKQFNAPGARSDQPSEGDHTRLTQKQAATDAGLSKHKQVTAVRVANIPANDFETAIESDAPPTVTSLAEMGRRKPLIDLQGRDPAVLSVFGHCPRSDSVASLWSHITRHYMSPIAWAGLNLTTIAPLFAHL